MTTPEGEVQGKPQTQPNKSDEPRKKQYSRPSAALFYKAPRSTEGSQRHQETNKPERRLAGILYQWFESNRIIALCTVVLVVISTCTYKEGRVKDAIEVEEMKRSNRLTIDSLRQSR